MKWFVILFMAIGQLQWCYADEPEGPPTYETRKYDAPANARMLRSTGLPFATGVVKHELPQVTVPASALRSDAPHPKSFHLKEFSAKGVGLPLTGIYDQGNCGSCVYNSVMKNLGDSMRLRGKDAPVQSRQWAMDCAQRQWMCDGSFFEYVAKGVAAKGGAPSEASYPYRARNQSCQGSPAFTSQIKSYEIIDASAKSIAAALLKGYPVSVTVAADGTWMNYGSGIYNGCSSMGTNHQVLIYGYDCETSVDSNGKCVYNDRGYPVNGDGYAIVVNSWGERWGVNGEMKSRWLGRSGQKCNNLAEEAGILETGIPFVPEPEPGPGPGPGPGPDPGPTPEPASVPLWAVILGAVVLLAGVVLALFVKK